MVKRPWCSAFKSEFKRPLVPSVVGIYNKHQDINNRKHWTNKNPGDTHYVFVFPMTRGKVALPFSIARVESGSGCSWSRRSFRNKMEPDLVTSSRNENCFVDARGLSSPEDRGFSSLACKKLNIMDTWHLAHLINNCGTPRHERNSWDANGTSCSAWYRRGFGCHGCRTGS